MTGSVCLTQSCAAGVAGPHERRVMRFHMVPGDAGCPCTAQPCFHLQIVIREPINRFLRAEPRERANRRDRMRSLTKTQSMFVLRRIPGKYVGHDRGQGDKLGVRFVCIVFARLPPVL